MYNRYLKTGELEQLLKAAENGGAESASPSPRTENEPRRQPGAEVSGKSQPRQSGALKNLLGGLKLPELNSDTLLLLVLVYFLIADEGENISDTLLIIGVLLLLGF